MCKLATMPIERNNIRPQIKTPYVLHRRETLKTNDSERLSKSSITVSW